MIEGRVAQILNDRELVFNRGSQDGVVRGMHFEVLLDPAIEVTDPDTGESLGNIERPKVEFRATEVREKFTIGRTVLFSRDGEEIRELDFFRPYRRSQPMLRPREALRPLSDEESIVRVGDRVKQVGTRRVPQSRVASG